MANYTGRLYRGVRGGAVALILLAACLAVAGCSSITSTSTSDGPLKEQQAQEQFTRVMANAKSFCTKPSAQTRVQLVEAREQYVWKAAKAVQAEANAVTLPTVDADIGVICPQATQLETHLEKESEKSEQIEKGSKKKT